MGKRGPAPEITEKWLQPENVAQIQEWAAQGFNNMQIYKELMKVSKDTFYRLKKTCEISTALKKGREQAVEDAKEELPIAAMKAAFGGYELKERVETFDSAGNSTGVKETTKTAGPNATMLIFMMCNLLPEKYKNLRQTEANIKLEELPKIDMSTLDDREIIEIVRANAKK